VNIASAFRLQNSVHFRDLCGERFRRANRRQAAPSAVPFERLLVAISTVALGGFSALSTRACRPIYRQLG
jgi:hypothetical protein